MSNSGVLLLHCRRVCRTDLLSIRAKELHIYECSNRMLPPQVFHGSCAANDTVVTPDVQVHHAQILLHHRRAHRHLLSCINSEA